MIVVIRKYQGSRSLLSFLRSVLFLGLIVLADKGESAATAGPSVPSWVGEGEDAESRKRFRAIQGEDPLDSQKQLTANYLLSIKSLGAVGFRGVIERSFIGQAALMGNEEAVNALFVKLGEEYRNTDIPWTKTFSLFIRKVILKLDPETFFTYFRDKGYPIEKKEGGISRSFREKGYDAFADLLESPGNVSLGHILAYFGMDTAFKTWIERPDTVEELEGLLERPGPSLAWMVYWGEGETEEKRYNILKTLKGHIEAKGFSFEKQKALLTGPFTESVIADGQRIEVLSAYEGIKTQGIEKQGRPRLCGFLERILLLERDTSASQTSSSRITDAETGPSFLLESLQMRDAGGRNYLHWLFEDEKEGGALNYLKDLFKRIGKEKFQEVLNYQERQGFTVWHQALRFGTPKFLKKLWGLHEGFSSKKIEAWGRNVIEDEKAREITQAFLSFNIPSSKIYGKTSPARHGAVASSVASSGAGGMTPSLSGLGTPVVAAAVPSNPVSPLLHEAFLHQSLAKFEKFVEAFKGVLGLVDQEKETLFQKGAHVYKEATTKEDQKTLYDKFQFALHRIGTKKGDPIIGQGTMIQMQFAKDRSSVWKLLEMSAYSSDQTFDPLQDYVKELDALYQEKLKERERREGRATIDSIPVLGAFDEGFYRISTQLFAAQQVLATGMVTREETGAEAAVGYIEVVGEMIPLPGAAVVGRILTAIGKGYLGAAEEGRIGRTADRHARSDFDALSRGMTLALEEPLEDLTKKSAETLGEVLGYWFLTREPAATEFTFIEGLIVDVLKDGGISTFLDSRSRLSLKRTNSESITVQAWLHGLGIRDTDLKKEWHREGASPIAYIEGREEQATALGFVDGLGVDAQKKIGTTEEDSVDGAAVAAGASAGIRAAAGEESIQEGVQEGVRVAAARGEEVVRTGVEAAKGCGCSVQ